jgi:hypothetical protein
MEEEERLKTPQLKFMVEFLVTAGLTKKKATTVAKVCILNEITTPKRLKRFIEDVYWEWVKLQRNPFNNDLYNQHGRLYQMKMKKTC